MSQLSAVKLWDQAHSLLTYSCGKATKKQGLTTKTILFAIDPNDPLAEPMEITNLFSDGVDGTPAGDDLDPCDPASLDKAWTGVCGPDRNGRWHTFKVPRKVLVQ